MRSDVYFDTLSVLFDAAMSFFTLGLYHFLRKSYGQADIGRPLSREILSLMPRAAFLTPTACSWRNAVETFFAALTKRRLRLGVFRSIVDLQAAINRYIAEHNTQPMPFVWTAVQTASSPPSNVGNKRWSQPSTTRAHPRRRGKAFPVILPLPLNAELTIPVGTALTQSRAYYLACDARHLAFLSRKTSVVLSMVEGLT